MGRGYHKRLAHLYRMVIPEGLRVLEIGCGQGDLLDALKPSEGVGVDFSPEMIRQAEKRYSHLRFVCADAHDFRLEGVFDAVVLSDILNDLWDVQQLLRNLKHCIGDHTRIVIKNYRRLCSPFFHVPPAGDGSHRRFIKAGLPGRTSRICCIWRATRS